MPHRRIEEVLRGKRLLRLPPTATVRQAAREMASKHVATVVVAEPDGRLDGIFTERDLLERVVSPGVDPDNAVLGQVMTRQLQTITMQHTVRDALREMDRHGIRHLPVLDDGAVVGIVSMRDFIGEEVAEIEHEHDFATQLAEELR